jgi:hypothetical protein
MKEARQYLGSGFFRKALFDWTIDELERTMAGSWLTDAELAYGAILHWRKGQEENLHPLAQIIPFPQQKKAA